MGQSTRCLALFSGGLDSQLAARLIHQQGIAVELFAFRSVFTCYDDLARTAAEQLDLPLHFIEPRDDYLSVLQTPRFGYGRGANPCIDCRIYMLRCLATHLERNSRDFVITGEVLGQRAFGQKRKDLEAIAYHAGLEDRLLRPLSAKQLAITHPEREGWVDRSKLFGLHGSSRTPLIQLAKELHLPDVPPPTSGCRLTDPAFGTKVFDLARSQPLATWWDYRLLRVGRHFRQAPHVRYVVGRNAEENEQLEKLFVETEGQAACLITPANFRGPTVLMIAHGPEACSTESNTKRHPPETLVNIALGLVHRYSRHTRLRPRKALVRHANGQEARDVQADARADQLKTITAAFDPPTSRNMDES